MSYRSAEKYPLLSEPSKSTYCYVDPASGKFCRVHFHDGSSLAPLDVSDFDDDFEEDDDNLTVESSRDVDVVGTSLRGYITTTRRNLVDVFGKPTMETNDSDEKTTTEWWLEFSDGTVATIYDWKRYEMGAPTNDEETTWNIGGKTNRSVELVEKFLGIS